MNAIRAPFPDDLVLAPVSRWPTTLPDETRRAVLGAPVEQRVQQVAHADDHPTASIVVVTLDGLVFTRLCLESLLANTSSITYEVIVVDNGSTDGTREYLREVAGRDAQLHVQLSEQNVGFAAATNRGVALARGSVLVLLNNDTIVPEGWLESIVKHLADDRIGLLGAVTNRAGNEAEIEVPYRDYGELHRFVREHVQVHSGELLDIRTATMFCAALRRDTWERLGPLDEQFEVALFEDDDYSMRARQAGYRVVCAEDVFVHHFGQASIGQLGPTGKYGEIFHANRTRWEAKWATAWQPYDRREKPAYRELVDRIRRVICETVPPDSTVLVLSKGDVELLKLEGRRAWHFPQCEDGTYAGHNPADSAACIGGLEALRAKGGSYLVVPTTMKWWLEYYAEFQRHISDRYRVVTDRESCLIVSLSGDVHAA